MAFYKEDIVDINLNTGNIFRSFLGHSIGYKDDDADRFGIRAFRDGVPVDLSGASCQAIFMNPNGTNIALTSYGTVSGNVAYVTLPPACYDYEGQFCLAIKLVGGGVTGTVRIVDGTVTRTGASGAVAPTASVPTYQEILSTYDAMVAATSAANLAIAETFNAATAYPAGKYVINDGHLYRLTADHAANVTWANTSKVATNFGDDLSSLKSAFNTFVDGRNLFWNAPFVSGKYYYGGETSHSSFGYFIVPVTSGKTYKFGCNVRFLSSQTTGIDNTEHNPRYQYLATFTGDLYVTVRIEQEDSFAMCLSDYEISDVGTTAQPRLSQNLLAQESGDSESLAMSQAGVGNAISAVAVMRDGEGQVKPQNIEGVTVTGGNILDDAERVYCSQSGHVGGDGYVTISDSKAIIQNRSSFCSFLIAVKPNTHYTANNSIRFAVLLKNLATEGTAPVEYTTVVGSALANISSFDTGEADHIIVSWDYSTYPINTFVISEGNTPTTDVEITLPDWWTGGSPISEKPKQINKTGNLSNGTFIALTGYKQNLRKGERYVFSGDLTTMSELRFGFTYLNVFSASATIYNEFAIDGTYITYKTDGSNANYTNRYEHGLTFANNLQFIFEYLDEGNAKITLISNGMMFSQTLPFVKKTISQVVVRSVGSTLTNCKLSWIPIDIDKDIWMFGDSYFAYSSDRWTYYMQQYGYAQNALIDGWPGEGSVNARNSLLTLIQFGAPKYIVWCMGMNDGSDTDANTPSSDWTIRRDEMLAICNENGITPIFATIPNVPSILHTGKNAWIKASGYRYIDFAAAVGAESAGSTWYSGMLSSDNVHPSESGAKALFARALVDFPEIMIDE